MLTSLSKYTEIVPLFLRVFLGMTMLFSHGIPKLMEPERWEATGKAMASIGIGFAPTFWGFMAGATEALGGALLLLGLFVRPTSAVLIFVLFVAAAQNVMTAGSLGGGRAHPVDAMAGFIALLILGAGQYSLDWKFGFAGGASQRSTGRPAEVGAVAGRVEPAR
ncbi:MAG: DoxX family protein [Vicinamibacterales bacterium]